MALLFVDSFDHYVTADLLEKWTTVGALSSGATQTIMPTGGRRGSGSYRWTTGTASALGGSLSKALTPGDATFVLGFAVLVPTGTLGSVGIALAQVREGSACQLFLALNQDLTLSVKRGTPGSSTTLGTSTTPLPPGTYQYIEWRGTIANTGGTAVVRLNGVPILTVPPGDTQATAVAGWTTAVLGPLEIISSSGSGSSRTVDFDDLYILDGTGPAPWNDFLGDVRVDVRTLTGPGASAGWTPSAGANWQAVDDPTPNDDTDYTAAAATGLTDTFAVQDAPIGGGTLFGVQVSLSGKKTDAGVCLLNTVIRHGGVEYPGPNLAPSTAYSYLLQPYQTNPGTGAAWTEAGFNAAEFGYTRTA